MCHDYTGEFSGYAVDDDAATCTKTTIQAEAWWMVDLGIEHLVVKVEYSIPDGGEAERRSLFSVTAKQCPTIVVG